MRTLLFLTATAAVIIGGAVIAITNIICDDVSLDW